MLPRLCASVVHRNILAKKEMGVYFVRTGKRAGREEGLCARRGRECVGERGRLGVCNRH